MGTVRCPNRAAWFESMLPCPRLPCHARQGFTAGRESAQLGDHLDLNAATER